jgi:hypothetical protein
MYAFDIPRKYDMTKNNILYVKNEVTKPSKNFSKIE